MCVCMCECMLAHARKRKGRKGKLGVMCMNGILALKKG